MQPFQSPKMTEFQFVNTDHFDQKTLTDNRYFCEICDRKLNDIRLTDDDFDRFKTKHGYNCNICYKVYRNLNALKEHQSQHFNGNDLKVACIECTSLSKTLDTGCDILEIGEIYTKNDVRSEFHCEKCDRFFDVRSKYVQHLRNHYDRTVYTCDYCNGIKIIGWERWNIHKTTAHEEMEPLAVDLSYKCSVCSTVILNISEFQKHLSHCQSSTIVRPINLHDGDSTYCGVCCVEMPEIRSIQQQLQSENHDSDYYRTSFETMNCLMCHRVFMSMGDLYDHQRKDHFASKYENRFACSRCLSKSNKFAHISNERTSTGSTTKGKTFCSICDKSIKVTCWSRHVRNHRDRVVYQCESCRKIRIGFFRFQNHFRQSSKCSNSMELNSEKAEKETKNYIFQCGRCKGTFSRRSFKTHINESDCYVENRCQNCPKRFITKAALNKHRLVDCGKIKKELKLDCATCEKSFHTRRIFALHSTVCQGKQRTIRCTICRIVVESNSNHWNDIHRRRCVVKLNRTADPVLETKSLAIRPAPTTVQFGCLLCDDTFGDRQQLRLHMNSHYCDKSSQCDTALDSLDAEAKYVDTLKDEKLMSSPTTTGENDDKLKILTSTDLVKTETTVNIDDMWTSNSDDFNDFANDDCEEINDVANSNDVIQYYVTTGMTQCCLCKNVIPDLVNTDEAVHEQISRFGETICLICFQLFSLPEKLREHESTHFQENLDGHLIACRSCAWSSNVYYTDTDFFRLEQDLQCYMCSAKMADLRTLRRHKRSHLSLCVFTCKVCNKKSISDERHKNHLRKHQKPELAVVTNQIVRKCTLCGEEATNLYRDEKDIDRMFEKFKGGPCLICFTYINDKKRYVSHERSHMEDQQLVSCFKCCNTKSYTDDEYHRLEDENTCFLCKAKLSSKYNLHLHKRKHLDRVVYSCTICLTLVVGTRNHSHHMYKHGLRKKIREEVAGRYECDYCQKIFPHKSSLPAHFKQHLNKERVPCPQCSLTFASKGNLTQHIKQIHLNIRKHICELCGKAFGHPHNLKSHMVKHSGEKPYQCPICLKRFGYYSRMKTHAWIHSGLKPYKCDQCDKCYNDSTDLRRHKRIHGGVEKKFECELCKIKFYEHKYLRAHRASAHKFLVQ
ncbi:zinc finger protein 845-like isoform X1 [Bradysia coprophila]|uniref:zinc finger protein 845-like isoform X1 n=1 Tax=Bradysia coprophila TaxID=38358 RepID=UPI00187D809C|nr:zinc finger protein 845-like isoform X1 [Bradysia coprophila]XP_037036665.1 zinc finger protein 845-like isoform X1 [Bradysia coprophila]